MLCLLVACEDRGGVCENTYDGPAFVVRVFEAESGARLCDAQVHGVDLLNGFRAFTAVVGDEASCEYVPVDGFLNPYPPYGLVVTAPDHWGQVVTHQIQPNADCSWDPVAVVHLTEQF